MTLNDIQRGLNSLLQSDVTTRRNRRRVRALQDAWNTYADKDLGLTREIIQDRFDQIYSRLAIEDM